MLIKVVCALEKVQASLGSPPIVPDALPVEKQATLPPFEERGVRERS
jgi:hypothetical protein